MTDAISAWMESRRIHTIAEWRLRELLVRTCKVDPRRAQQAIDSLVEAGALVRFPSRALPGRGSNYRLAATRRSTAPSPRADRLETTITART